ncbi:MAG: proprotein convertase P-domain-containing protein [Bacteroidota bacterium]
MGKLRVRNLNIDHSWIGDLTISLTSPQGTEVFLMDQIPCSSSDIRVDFDDDASSTYADMVALCPFTVPGINGLYQPLGSLADFSGEPIQGTWTLTITDNFFIDGGTLTGWELEICEVIPEVLYATPDTLQTCVGESASFSLQMGDSFDAASGVSVIVSNLPLGAQATIVSPSTPNSNQTVTLSQLNTIGNYDLEVIAQDVFGQRTENVHLQVIDQPQAQLLTPGDSVSQISLDPVLHWESTFPADSFVIELSTDPSFGTILQSITSTVDSVNLQGLSNAQYYHWRVISYNDCGSEVSEPQVFSTAWLTSIEQWGDLDFRLFPNPASDQIRLTVDQSLREALPYKIFTTTGQLIDSGMIPAGTNEMSWEVGHWPSGMYLLQIQSEQVRFAERFVISH